MLKIESTGKNIEQAIENGLAELKVSRDNVSIKIIEKGGIFKKAKVELIVDEDFEQEILSRESRIKALEKKLEENENNENAVEVEKDANLVAETNANKSNQISEEESEEDEVQNLSEVASGVVSFIKSTCAIQNIIVKAQVKENKDDIEINLSGENVDEIIGFRGEGLNALQYLANIYASKLNKNCPRIYLNVGNFKEERQQSLIKLARRLASKVAKTKQSIKLEPMNAFDRKIVHSALQNDSYVTTFSVGEEPKRCLVIDLKK